MKTTQATQEQMNAFMSADMSEPVCLVNLLKYKPLAAYESGAPEAGNGSTGEQAYERYWNGCIDVFQAIGAKPILFAPATRFMIGDGDWDAVALVWYPSRKTCLEISLREDYQAIYYHRKAALSHQDLIETTPGGL